MTTLAFMQRLDRTPARPAAPPLLTIERLAVSFEAPHGRSIDAVQCVDLTIQPGQMVAIVGESGSGKSVTALSIMRLIEGGHVRGGRIRFNGIDLLELSARQMRRIRGRDIAMIFQEPMTSLNPVFTIGEQIIEPIRMHQRISRRAARDAAIRALKDVGIEEAARRLKSYPHEFSGGMRQRVMIAMALACQSRLLIADEPTTALDVTVQKQILDLLDHLRRMRNLAILFITHDLGVVAERADVTAVMYGGRIVERGPTNDLLNGPRHPYTKALLRCAPVLGRRRDRLETIGETLSADFDTGATQPGTYRPWWPHHEPPAGMAVDANGIDSTLTQVGEGHHIACWAAEQPQGAAIA